MRRFLTLPLLAAFGTMPAAAATPLPVIDAPVLTTNVDGDLGLDTTGAVEFYRVSSDVPAAVAAKTQELVRQLRFEPVSVDGQPVRAHARMRVTLVETPLDDDRFSMRLDGFSFPEEEKTPRPAAPREDGIQLKVDRKRNPRYPESAARLGVDADVLVQVLIARDGHIADASVRQSAILGAGGDPKAVARLLGEFEAQSLRAIRGWHVAVTIPDSVEPKDVQMSACVPVRFRMFGHPDTKPPGQWQWMVRSQKQPAPWLPPDPSRPLAGVADVGGNDMLAGESRFRLAPSVPQAL